MKLGFIDYYLDEWHANQYPRMIREVSGGEIEVAYVYGMIDSPLPGGRTTEKWCADMNIPRCATIEELIEKCDALVVLSPDNCEMHEQLCQLPLRSGKRTYIDKTFAPDYATGKRIFDLAEAHGTPCYSTSALRFAAEYQGIDPRTVRGISAWGPGGFETYIIHQLEPVMMLMQAKAARVMAMPGEGFLGFAIAFEDGRTALLSSYAQGSPFAMNVCMAGENRVLEVKSDFFGAFIQALVQFFRTGKAPVDHAQTLEIMRVRGAGVKALEKPFEWTKVDA